MKTAIINVSEIKELEVVGTKESTMYWYRPAIKLFGKTLIRGSIRIDGFLLGSIKIHELPFGCYLEHGKIYELPRLKIYTKDKTFNVKYESFKQAEDTCKKILTLPIDSKFNVNY